MKDDKFITVGIPTYNSSKYIDQCLKSVTNIIGINEILISDDGSTPSELKRLKEIVLRYQTKFNLDIKILEAPTNAGAYKNKLKLIENSKNEYIYVLDSDNIASKNLDKIINKVLEEDNPKFLYQPNIMYQFWKYPKLAKLMSTYNKKYIVKFFDINYILNKRIVKKLLIQNSGTYNLKDFRDKLPPVENLEKKLIDKWIFWILNCGNFIVSKKYMLDIAEAGLKFDRKVLSVDAIVFSYLWLDHGFEIKIFNDFYHHHRKRNDSVSFTESKDSVNAIKYFIDKVLDF
jgi:glycosyltransferase involved in cell wall biosynthesis